MAYNRDKSKHGKYGYDSDEDDRVLFFLPSEDIDFEVLASDLKCYLGNGAQVEIGSHHRVSAACHFCLIIFKDTDFSRVASQATTSSLRFQSRRYVILSQQSLQKVRILTC
jgi:hypothetical protein